jgi:RimJ/RimL family protein N-acetyltransferase
MTDSIRIREIGPAQRDLLVGMYDRFVPLGAALGLPPPAPEERRAWVGRALAHKVNVAAFSPAANVVGHCFLAADQAGSAELAIFVDQEFRGRGVGTALVMAALEWGAETGLRRVWSLTSSDNRAALRLQERCGFRVQAVSVEIEMEVDLAICEYSRRTPSMAPIFAGKYAEQLPWDRESNRIN